MTGHAGVGQVRRLALGVEDLLGGDPVDDRVGDLVAHRGDVGLLAGTVEPVGEALLDDVVDDALHRRRPQLLFGLAPELRLREGDLHRGDEALLDVVLAGAVVARLRRAWPACFDAWQQRVVDRPGEGPVEAGEVGAALGRGDGVDEGDDVGLVALDPAQGDLDGALAGDLGHLAVDGDLLGEGVDAADA